MFGAQLLLVLHLGRVLFFGVSVTVTGSAERQEDERQHGEDECLNEADEDLQKVERYRPDDRQQEANY